MSDTRRIRAHRSARQDSGAHEGIVVARATQPRRVLIVDLNNFASFPTLAIGLLTASLRNRGHEVQVLCPLAYDVPAVERERRENVLDHLKRRPISRPRPPPFPAFTAFKSELVEYAKTKSAPKLPKKEPLPIALIEKMAAHHTKHNVEQTGKKGARK